MFNYIKGLAGYGSPETPTRTRVSFGIPEEIDAELTNTREEVPRNGKERKQRESGREIKSPRIRSSTEKPFYASESDEKIFSRTISQEANPSLQNNDEIGRKGDILFPVNTDQPSTSRLTANSLQTSSNNSNQPLHPKYKQIPISKKPEIKEKSGNLCGSKPINLMQNNNNEQENLNWNFKAPELLPETEENGIKGVNRDKNVHQLPSSSIKQNNIPIPPPPPPLNMPPPKISRTKIDPINEPNDMQSEKANLKKTQSPVKAESNDLMGQLKALLEKKNSKATSTIKSSSECGGDEQSNHSQSEPQAHFSGNLKFSQNEEHRDRSTELHSSSVNQNPTDLTHSPLNLKAPSSPSFDSLSENPTNKSKIDVQRAKVLEGIRKGKKLKPSQIKEYEPKKDDEISASFKNAIEKNRISINGNSDSESDEELRKSDWEE